MAAMRVLVLWEQGSDLQTERAVHALAQHRGDGIEIAVRTIGRGGDHRHAGSAVLALRGEPGSFDVIHAWGGSALAAAVLGAAGPILFSPSRWIGQRGARWLRAAMGYRDIHVISPAATQRRVLVERGIPISRCHLLRPGVEFSRVRKRNDSDLRAAMGFAPDDRVLLAPGESTEASDHALAVWAGSMLHILDPRYKVLIWGRGPRAGRSVSLARQLGRPELARSAEMRLGRRLEFESLTAAADVALVTARGPVATLPIAICMAAGLPIVSTVTYSIAELLEDRHSACMVSKPAPRLIARRVLELYEDAELRRSIADIARTEAYEFNSMSRFLSQFRTVYGQLAKREKIEIPAIAPAAGSRFHGRA